MPGVSPALNGEQLFSFAPKLNNNRHYLTRKVPEALGKAIQQDYKTGSLKFFGATKSFQEKGKEGLIWLLSTVYNKTVERDKKVVELNAEAMEDRYGKSNAVNWYTLTEYCMKQGYLKRDDKYCPAKKNMSFWIPSQYLGGEADYYFTFKQAVIKNKIKEEKERYSLKQNEREKNAGFLNRSKSIEITKSNISRLDFDYERLEDVCKTHLNIQLSTIKAWLKEVKKDADFCYPNPEMGSSPIEYIKGYMEGRYKEYSTHSVPLFLEEKKSKNGQLSLQLAQKRTTYVENATPGNENSKGIPEDIKQVLRDSHCRDSETGDTVKTSSTLKKDWTEEERASLSRRHLFSSLVSLHLDMKENSVFTDSAGGRLYSPLVPLNRKARPALRYRGESNELEHLVSFDVKSSQPWFLGLAVYNHYKNKGEAIPENVLEYLELVEKKDVYYAILEYAGIECTKENRDDIKAVMFTDIFRSQFINHKKSNKKSNQPFTPGGQFLKEKFPVVWNWILKNKGREEKSKVPIMMQKAEADYFIGKVIPELNAMGIWCLTIHDSVIVREKDAERVREYLDSSILDCFGRKPDIKPEYYGK